MTQVYKVAKAFLSTNDDKTPQEVQTKGGVMHKYMVQVANQPVDGWMGILKKPGNAINEGDELYGDIVENNWGKPQFNRAQLPQDGSVRLGTSSSAPVSATQTAPKAPQAAVEGEDKLDYIISLLENFLESQGVAKTAPAAQSAKDGDAPVDLSQIDY